jgi:uncharacterized membrane protein HdeD (DUF308 family)
LQKSFQIDKVNFSVHESLFGGNMRLISNWGLILLAVYLILIGVIALANVAISPIVLGVIALVAGILILIGR